MPHIKILDENTANKIAAGEVIERPASVVKELLENSLDAKSKRITVEIKDGGKRLIKVIDDGEGMFPDDCTLAFERHATSKIESIDDLEHVTSMGFRGEALPSIASVSRVTLVSRQKGGLSGTQVTVEGGKIGGAKEAGCPEGTAIAVKDLFYNTPARLKFLKNPSTELTNVTKTITRFALIYPEISFRLLNDGKELINLPEAPPLERIAGIYGREVAKDMIPLDYKDDFITIGGFISKPSLTRATRASQSIFVNRRHIKNKLLTRAIQDGYHTLLQKNRFPVVVLSIEIDPKFIDVNVHPTKIEVKFKREWKVHDTIMAVVNRTLLKSRLTPEIREIAGEKAGERAVEKTGMGTTTAGTKPSHTTQQAIIKDPTAAYGPEAHAPQMEEDLVPGGVEKPEKEKIKQFTPLCQIHNTYIIAQHPGGFAIIDQHAAHERVLFEEQMKRFEKDKILSQDLISPAVIDTKPEEAVVLNENLDLFKRFGFVIEPFGGGSFIVKSLPVIMGKIEDKKGITDVLDELVSFSRIKTLDSKKEEIITMTACRSAIKAGEVLLPDTMQKLLDRLLKLENPNTCPHGRPVIITMDLEELEKRFKRR